MESLNEKCVSAHGSGNMQSFFTAVTLVRQHTHRHSHHTVGTSQTTQLLHEAPRLVQMHLQRYVYRMRVATRLSSRKVRGECLCLDNKTGMGLYNHCPTNKRTRLRWRRDGGYGRCKPEQVGCEPVCLALTERKGLIHVAWGAFGTQSA